MWTIYWTIMILLWLHGVFVKIKVTKSFEETLQILQRSTVYQYRTSVQVVLTVWEKKKKTTKHKLRVHHDERRLLCRFVCSLCGS